MPVGQRAPTLNMSKILRQVGYRTGQSRKITYYRSPIYGKDDYGVENTTIAVNEIIVPDVQAYIRTLTTKDFVIQQGGGNIVGNALIYLPRLETLKNFPNMDQANNIYFNEIEGWDKIIDKDRVVYRIPTSGTTDWATDGTATFSSDGEALTATTGVLFTNGITYTPTSPVNTLEANRVRFKIRISGGSTNKLRYYASYNGGSSANHYILWDQDPDFALTNDTWLSVDTPFISGTSATSIYQEGTRHPVEITSGSSFDYKGDLNKFTFNVEASEAAVQLKEIEFYKSIDWSVHSIRDYNDEYMCLECVRTSGKRQSLRRAYAE